MGIILFVLFLLVAAFVVYVVKRKENIPVGSIGIVSFLGARTLWVFGEGDYVRPFGCKVTQLEVKDHLIELPSEDVTCKGFRIVTKRAKVRYRLRQPIPAGSGGRFRMTFRSLWRRIVPYTMDSRLAEFLNTRETLPELIPAKAQGALSAFCAPRPHESILGYHVVKFVEDMIAGGTAVIPDPDDTVHQTREQLCAAVLAALTTEYESSGLEFISFTIDDYDPDEVTKAHITQAQENIREIQVRRLQTSAEVARALEIATAAATFAKEHPGADLAPYYSQMRQLDINQIGAENLGIFGQLLQALLGKLQPAA